MAKVIDLWKLTTVLLPIAIIAYCQLVLFCAAQKANDPFYFAYQQHNGVQQQLSHQKEGRALEDICNCEAVELVTTKVNITKIQMLN